MITIRPFNPDLDLATVQQWWKARGQADLPIAVLPVGWIASSASVELAASFLYLVEKKIAVIEWTTTNPNVTAGPEVVDAVKALYAHLENEAWNSGCAVVISFVTPDSWEHRTLGKRGYSAAGGAHAMLIKPFDRKEEKA